MNAAKISLLNSATGQICNPFSLMIKYSVGAASRKRTDIISTGSSSLRTTLIAMYDIPQKTTGNNRNIDERRMMPVNQWICSAKNKRREFAETASVSAYTVYYMGIGRRLNTRSHPLPCLQIGTFRQPYLPQPTYRAPDRKSAIEETEYQLNQE